MQLLFSLGLAIVVAARSNPVDDDASLCTASAAHYTTGQSYVPYEYQTAPPPIQAPSALENKYQAMLNKTCAAVLVHVPTLPAADANNFMTAYAAYNGTNSEADVIRYAGVLLSRKDVQAFIARTDSFNKGGLDASLALCAVLVQATPAGLANFSGAGKAQEALVDALLGNPVLMRDMLVAGGASTGPRPRRHSKGPLPMRYGQAMAIYTDIVKASAVLSPVRVGVASEPAPWDDRSQTKQGVLHRLAIGTAVEHAATVNLRWKQVVTPPWGPTSDGSIGTVDPVARYMYYEASYLAGDLDPAFEVLTAFEMRHVANSDAVHADLTWMRETTAMYNPSLITGSYTWRYAEAVKADVKYGHTMCDTHPGLCDGHYTQIPAMNGVCGYRAFFGRFSRNAFGLPTWGFKQKGHGAMTTWTPKGWEVLLGASWPFGWWGEQSGLDFHLDVLARELRGQYQTVLRGQWAANARGDAPAGQHFGDGVGGLWSVLMLYNKKAIVAGTPSIPPRPIGPAAVPSKVAALIANWPTPAPTPKITTRADGTINVPAAAYDHGLTKGRVRVMNSADGGDQLLHSGGDLFKPNTSALTYQVPADAAGTYYLTANHSTWHVDQDLKVSVNGVAGKASNVPVYFTIGYWNETQAVEIPLVKGTNTLTFTRLSTRPVTFKEFFLYKHKPTHIPAPPGNYTPKPIMPPPPDSNFILESPDTSCVKQGIQEVPAQYCDEACKVLGFKPTGARARPTPPGCFVMMEGKWKGNCNFNSNKSATCDDPPCTLFGSKVQNICLRQ